MKYEYLCGHVSDFFTMPENVIAVVRLDHCVQGLTEFSQITECGKPVLAMRRIIKTPVWTMADKLAGRLPEVGCKAVQIQGFCEVDVLMIHNGCVVVCNSEISDSRPAVFKIDSFMELFTPIETQAEKAKRLEDEWVEKAYDDLLAHIGIHSTESPDFVKQNLHRVYNALLSGELQAPKGE